MFIVARLTHVVCIATIAWFGGASCGSERSPTTGQSGSDSSAKASSAAGGSASNAAPSGTPAVGEQRQRFGSEEIELAVATMKACADRDNSPRSMFECACRSDLSLSKEPAPADPAAHCAAYADRTAALAQRSEDEQKRAPLQLAASDVAPGSFILFAVAAPCLIDAIKSKKKEQAYTCLCVVHAIANRIALRKELRTQADYMVALGEEASGVKSRGQCRTKDAM
jgi:hypothetical protein